MAVRGHSATTMPVVESSPTSRDPVGEAPSTPASAPTEDWPKQATVQIVRVVDTVRDKTTGPVLTAAQALVYGLVAVTAIVMVLVLVTIGAVRGLTTLLERAWLVYLILGALYCAVGFLLWTRRQPRPAATPGNNPDAPPVP